MNAFSTFKPEATESKLINKKAIVHMLFADALCLYFTGLKMHEVGADTLPSENSLAYRALVKSYKFAKFNYGYPNTESKLMTHFDTNPVVYLVRGPNKCSDTTPYKGLEYFTNKGIKPTLTILNEHFNPLNIRFVDHTEKKGGSIWMIFDAENFVMPERPPRRTADEDEEPAAAATEE